MIGLIVVLSASRPIVVDKDTELFVLEMQPVYTFKFDKLIDYQVVQISFNNQIKGAVLNEFISHPQKVYPTALNMTENYLLLAFPAGAVVNQIQYLGSSLQMAKVDIKAKPFNLLMYYRFKNDELFTFEMENLNLTNAYRLEKALPPCKFLKKIFWTARSKSLDMAVNNYGGHVSPYYGDPVGILGMFGVSTTSLNENLMNSNNPKLSPQDALVAWQSDEGHDNNLLSANQYLGVGCFVTKTNSTKADMYFSQQFANISQAQIDKFKFGEGLVLEPEYDMTPVGPDEPVVPDVPIVPDEPIVPDGPTDGPKVKSFNAGQIVGIVIGVIALCAVIGSTIAFVLVKTGKVTLRKAAPKAAAV